MGEKLSETEIRWLASDIARELAREGMLRSDRGGMEFVSTIARCIADSLRSVVETPVGPTATAALSDEPGPVLRNDAPARAVKIEQAPGTVRELASLLVAERAAHEVLAVDEWHAPNDRKAAKETLAVVLARLTAIAAESDAPADPPAAPEPKVSEEDRAAHDVAAVDIANAAVRRAPRCTMDGCARTARWLTVEDGASRPRCDGHRLHWREGAPDGRVDPAPWKPEVDWLDAIVRSGSTMGFPLTTIAEVGHLVAREGQK